MRFLLLRIIDLYQLILSPRSGLLMPLGAGLPCKYEISCSNYMKAKIVEKGVLKGFWLGIRRIISCR